MEILILEDRGSVAFYMKEALEQQGHTVYSAYNIYDARSCLDNAWISCLIVDLNMPPVGLTEEQAAQTNYGTFTGWLWLRDEVYPRYPGLRPRTILYSEYLTDFHMMMPEEDLTGVTLMDKRGGGGAPSLLKRVARLDSTRPAD